MAADISPPTLDDILRSAERILADLPPQFRELLADVAVKVIDWPDNELLDQMGIVDPLELTGLYQGTPIGESMSYGDSTGPNLIFLFRMPILFEWCERKIGLEEVVFDVLTHEIGHHFGMNEAEVLRMEGRQP